MAVLAVYRNGVFRFYQGVDQFDFLLAGMSGYMCILENNLGTFHGKLIDENSAAVTGSVHTGAILVDGLGVGDVGNIVLRDRQHLSEDGIMIVVMT